MQCTEFVEWIKGKFFPDPVVLPDSIIMQRVQDAFDYWNNHSAYKTMAEFPVTFTSTSPGTLSMRSGYAQLTPKFKFVTRVFPNRLEANGLNYNPENMLLGLYVTNRFMTEDMIQWRHWLKGWQTYANSNFRAEFKESEDPLNVGGTVYIQSMPFYSTKVTVEGGLRILEGDDIKDPQIYNWLREYAFILCQEQQGRSVRKASMIGLTTDGDAMVSEANARKKEMEEELNKSGRWLMLMQRG